MGKNRPMIAVRLPETEIGREILMGFHAEAVAAEWVDMVYLGNSDLTFLEDPVWDGVIIGPIFRPGAFARPKNPRLPIVAVDADLSAYRIPSVIADDEAIGITAAEQLLQMGYRTVAAFGWVGWNQEWFLVRAQALQRHVESAGAAFGGLFTITPKMEAKLSNDEIAARAIRWLRSLAEPAAVLAGCDAWGRVLHFWCRRAGVNIPEEVAVMGVNNNTLTCETSVPPLSSVSVPWRRIGAEAARLLGRRLAGNGRRHTGSGLVVRVGPNGVVVRRSSDLLAVTDPNVAAVLRIIREHATEKIGVPDLLRHVPIGRHTLQRAFRKHLGRSILDEIRRVRVERAKGLLCTTDLTMPEVAERCGFANAAKLSDHFRRETGTTPGAFRREFRIA